MALEKQITFKTNVTKTIDAEIEEYLRTAEVDPAAIQIVIDGGNGVKTATLTYGSREDIKAVYEQQGRTYSNADAVTYCHVKDIILPFTGDLDKEVNDFLMDADISAISITRYFTLANQGAFIFYINLAEQKAKIEEKKAEVAEAQEKMAQELARNAVKDVELNTDDTVEKYAEMTEQQDEGKCENCDGHCECKADTAETPDEATETVVDEEPVAKAEAPVTEKNTTAKTKKGMFNKRNK